ncbi:MAG: helix-turn-helix domain-containing protein [Xenococcaceae cyanobacterium]
MKNPKINSQKEQLKKLKELGSCLHQIRTEQRISIGAIAEKTRIQARLLRAIEEGQIEVLPEPVYIRGFIQQFANALGLNGVEFASAFPTDSSIGGIKYTFWWRLPSLQLRPLHLYLLYILLVMFSVRGLSNVLKHSALEVSRQQPVVQSSSESQSTQSAAQPLSVSGQHQAKPVVVDITLKDQCWLRVVVDGKTEFEGILPEGTHRTWVANEQLTVRAGNAGGVLVAFNDEQAKQLGEPGQEQEVTYQANPRS